MRVDDETTTLAEWVEQEMDPARRYGLRRRAARLLRPSMSCRRRWRQEMVRLRSGSLSGRQVLVRERHVQSDRVVRAVRGRRGWTRTMGEARFRSRGSCGVFAPAEVLSPVERAEERLDVPRVPGFEPVPDSAKSPRNPAFVGKTEGLCGSERVRKRLTERETAGSTAGSGQPSGTSTAESFLRRVGRRSVGSRPRSGEVETRASTKCRPRSPGASSDIRRIACSAVRHCGRRLGVPPTLSSSSDACRWPSCEP